MAYNDQRGDINTMIKRRSAGCWGGLGEDKKAAK